VPAAPKSREHIDQWQIKQSWQADYLQACADAATDDGHFANFKRNSSYVQILEHVSPRMGQNYLNHIQATHPELLRGSFWESFRQNDKLGGAKIAPFVSEPVGKVSSLPQAADAISASASTLAYVSVLADLLKYYGQSAFVGKEQPGSANTADVCEIGGGYGGLAHMILSYANQSQLRRSGTRPLRYHIYDLPEPAALQRRYLSQLGWPTEVVTATTLHVSPQQSPFGCSLVISNYAFSELSKAVQMIYARDVVSKASLGLYFVINHFNRVDEGVELLKEHGFKIQQHQTATPEFKGVYVLVGYANGA